MAAPKLKKEAQETVRQGVIGGLRSSEINTLLREAGHPEVTEATLAYYRALPDVRDAIAQREEAVKQVGLARFSNRVAKLDRHANALEKRLYSKPDQDTLNPGDAIVTIAVSREYRATLKDISDLVDPAKQAKVDLTTNGKDLKVIVEYAKRNPDPHPS